MSPPFPVKGVIIDRPGEKDEFILGRDMSAGKENYIGAVNALLAELKPVLEPEAMSSLWGRLQADQALTAAFRLESGRISEIKIDPEPAVKLAIAKIFQFLPQQSDLVEMAAFKAFLDWNIPMVPELPAKSQEVS